MPPTPDGLLKFCRDVGFTNNTYHEASQQRISIPPTPATQSTWSNDAPEALKQEVRDIMTKTYGQEIEGFTFESYRMCWYVKPRRDVV